MVDSSRPSGKVYEDFNSAEPDSHSLPPPSTDSIESSSFSIPAKPSPTSSANAFPAEMSQNTAGAHVQPQPSIIDGLSTVRISDFNQVYQYPCARDGLVTGIAGGFGMMGLRLFWGSNLMKACNWASGTFMFVALASYTICNERRKIEKVHIKRAVEIMDLKKAEKEAQMKRRGEAIKRRQEEEEMKMRLEAEDKKWWFW